MLMMSLRHCSQTQISRIRMYRRRLRRREQSRAHRVRHAHDYDARRTAALRAAYAALRIDHAMLLEQCRELQQKCTELERQLASR